MRTTITVTIDWIDPKQGTYVTLCDVDGFLPLHVPEGRLERWMCLAVSTILGTPSGVLPWRSLVGWPAFVGTRPDLASEGTV